MTTLEDEDDLEGDDDDDELLTAAYTSPVCFGPTRDCAMLPSDWKPILHDALTETGSHVYPCPPASVWHP
ncbi:MAG: hypothetical protein IPK82_23960 [Polyangiaceae bacterium]|nr:hypothetical protein [Polyangiaceae bacterium]